MDVCMCVVCSACIMYECVHAHACMHQFTVVHNIICFCVMWCSANYKMPVIQS